MHIDSCAENYDYRLKYRQYCHGYNIITTVVNRTHHTKSTSRDSFRLQRECQVLFIILYHHDLYKELATNNSYVFIMRAIVISESRVRTTIQSVLRSCAANIVQPDRALSCPKLTVRGDGGIGECLAQLATDNSGFDGTYAVVAYRSPLALEFHFNAALHCVAADTC